MCNFLRVSKLPGTVLCGILSALFLSAAAFGQQFESLPPDSPEPAVQTALPAQPVSAPPLSLHDRFALEAKTTFSIGAFIIPAFESSITMAHPPDHFPREWRDGGGAFGRNYGASFARHTTAGLTHFATGALLREDPHYYSSASANYFSRASHAIAFTVFDRSNSGHRAIAFSNLAGSAAGGFIGTTFYPRGYDDPAHALQRAELELSDFGIHNLLAEFSPEFVRAAHKLHLPNRIANSFLPPGRRP